MFTVAFHNSFVQRDMFSEPLYKKYYIANNDNKNYFFLFVLFTCF